MGKQGEPRPIEVKTPSGKYYYPTMLSVIEEYYPDIRSTSQLDRLIRNEQNIPHTRDWPRDYSLRGKSLDRLPDTVCAIMPDGRLRTFDGHVVDPGR
jgi:hypothetical protein